MRACPFKRIYTKYIYMSILSGPTHLLRVRVPLQVVSRSTGGLEDPFMVRVLIHLDQHFIERGPYRSERERTLEIIGGDRNANCLIYHTCLGSINRGPGLYNQLSPLHREPRTRAGVETDGNAPLNWSWDLEGEGLSARDCLRDSQTICSL